MNRIMVDELKVWPGAWGPFLNGSCHLTTDGLVEDLHAFAIGKLALKPRDFQKHASTPHYDLTPARRAHAIALGAVEVSAREQARARLATRRGPLSVERGREVMAILQRFRMTQGTESALQLCIEQVLTRAHLSHRREASLSPQDRPDFLLPPGLAVEVKVKGPAAAVLRQLTRYVAHDQVGAVLLVTTQPLHVMPPEIEGKPVMTLCLGGAFL